MYGVWILQKDKGSYVFIMNSECGQPSILQETEDKLQVNFCDPAMRAWVQAGYYYSFDQ